LGTAFVEYTRCIAFLADNRAALLAAAEGASTKVLSLAPEHALAHHCLGCVQVASNRASQGIERTCALSRPDTLLRARLALLSLRSIRRFRHVDGAG